jgi:AcrR family transcriptional regulator
MKRIMPASLDRVERSDAAAGASTPAHRFGKASAAANLARPEVTTDVPFCRAQRLWQTAGVETLTPRVETGRVGETPGARRARAVAAAREIASESGYQAVTMREVAKRSNVARASLYRYFSSKDHLLCEVSLAFSAEILEQVERSQPIGASDADRVAYPFVLAFEALAREPKLFAATLRAYFADDPQVRVLAAKLRHFGGLYVSTGLSVDIPQAEDIARVLDPLSLVTAISISNGQCTLEDGVREFRAAVRLLVEGSQDSAMPRERTYSGTA